VSLKGSKTVSWPLTCGVLDRGDLHAARRYSSISPPRILRRRIFSTARSVIAAGVTPAETGGALLPRRAPVPPP
jgi:hypothetical protein